MEKDHKSCFDLMSFKVGECRSWLVDMSSRFRGIKVTSSSKHAECSCEVEKSLAEARSHMKKISGIFGKFYRHLTTNTNKHTNALLPHYR